MLVSLPWITDAVPPVTRLSSTLATLGCTTLTCPLWPIEKLCQLTMPRCDAWLIVMTLPATLPVTEPAITLPN